MGNLKRLGFTVFFIVALILHEKTCLNFNESSETGDTSLKFTCYLNFIPVQYEISIGPVQNSSESVSVSAWVKIQLEISGADCNTSTKDDFSIKLNTRNCKIDLTNVNVTKLVNSEHKQLKIIEQLLEENSTEENPTTNLIIHLNEKLEFGDQVILFFPYEIRLTRKYFEESWQGLYFYDPQGINISDDSTASRYYPLHAQFMFPAFDYFNPIRKPTFKISVARYDPHGFISLSNSEILESVQIAGMEEGWIMDNFQETPPMQVNQVTLMILGGYQNHTAHSAKNCTLNMWTLKYDGLYENNSAFNTAKEIQKAMDFFENTFNQTEYPLSKIDFVAVPWYTGGLVFHTNLGIVAAQTETILLQEKYNPAETKEFLRTQVVLQWFRGMVTSGIPPQSDGSDQDNFWLDGDILATYIGIWPLTETKLQTGTTLYAYRTHIGKFLLEIMESLFSQTIMKTAIAQIYLPKVVRDGAFPQDLSDSIQQAIKLHNATHILPQKENGTVTVTVTEIFDSWLSKNNQSPTVRITEVINDTSSIALYQQNTSEKDSTQMWWVPVKILTGKGDLFSIWLSPKHISLNSSLVFSSEVDTENEWLFVNPDSMGYYSTKYSDKLLQNIVKQLDVNHSEITVAGRKYLLINQFSFANDNKWEDIKSALETTKYLDNEMDLEVWTVAIQQVDKFKFDLMGHSDSFGKYFGRKMNKILNKIGIYPNDGESTNILKLRQYLLNLVNAYKIPLRSEYASNLMTDWMANRTDGNPFPRTSYHDALYCAAVENGNASVFNFILNQIIENSNSDYSDEKWFESRSMCQALTCVKDENLVASLLSENSKLAKTEVKKKGIMSCYMDNLPYELWAKKPLTMMQTVYDFWMRETLNGNEEPESFMRRLWALVPRGYEPPGFVEGVLKFLEDNNELLTETEELKDNVRDFKMSITSQPNRVEEFWKSGGIGSKLVKWFEDNME